MYYMRLQQGKIMNKARNCYQVFILYFYNRRRKRNEI